MKTARQWFAEGERIPFALASEGGRQVHISVHVFSADHGGKKGTPWVTFLHGFPTCSHDYYQLAEALKGRFNMLLWDYLGYGDSDKDLGPSFSVHTLADLQQQLWTHYAIEHTHIVAHDLGDTVLQELVARAAQRDGGAMPVIHRVFMFNGGIFPGLHRPVLMQRLLLTPVIGHLFSLAASEAFCARRIRRIFSKDHPPSDELVHEMYEAAINRGGKNIYHRLIAYVNDRQRHAQRWQHAIDLLISGGLGPQARVCFFWGLEDPISGAHMIAEVHARCQRLYGQSADGARLFGQSAGGYPGDGLSGVAGLREGEVDDGRTCNGPSTCRPAPGNASSVGVKQPSPQPADSPVWISRSGSNGVLVNDAPNNSTSNAVMTTPHNGGSASGSTTPVSTSNTVVCKCHTPVCVSNASGGARDDGRVRVCTYGARNVCRVVEVRNLGHWPLLEDPHAAAECLVSFLTGCEQDSYGESEVKARAVRLRSSL